MYFIFDRSLFIFFLLGKKETPQAILVVVMSDENRDAEYWHTAAEFYWA